MAAPPACCSTRKVYYIRSGLLQGYGSRNASVHTESVAGVDGGTGALPASTKPLLHGKPLWAIRPAMRTEHIDIGDLSHQDEQRMV